MPFTLPPLTEEELEVVRLGLHALVDSVDVGPRERHLAAHLLAITEDDG